jgi:hypothetical protein
MCLVALGRYVDLTWPETEAESEMTTGPTYDSNKTAALPERTSLKSVDAQMRMAQWDADGVCSFLQMSMLTTVAAFTACRLGMIRESQVGSPTKTSVARTASCFGFGKH